MWSYKNHSDKSETSESVTRIKKKHQKQSIIGLSHDFAIHLIFHDYRIVPWFRMVFHADYRIVPSSKPPWKNHPKTIRWIFAAWIPGSTRRGESASLDLGDLGKSRFFPWISGEIPGKWGKILVFHGGFFMILEEEIMEISWKYHGHIMEISWKYHGYRYSMI